jgi:hypothetical protein
VLDLVNCLGHRETAMTPYDGVSIGYGSVVLLASANFGGVEFGQHPDKARPLRRLAVLTKEP